MIEFQVNGEQYVAVVVPGDATNFENDGHVLMYDRKISGILYASAKTLPAGNYKIIGKVKDLIPDNMTGIYELAKLCNERNLSDNHLIIEKIG